MVQSFCDQRFGGESLKATDFNGLMGMAANLVGNEELDSLKAARAIYVRLTKRNDLTKEQRDEAELRLKQCRQFIEGGGGPAPTLAVLKDQSGQLK